MAYLYLALIGSCVLKASQNLYGYRLVQAAMLEVPDIEAFNIPIPYQIKELSTTHFFVYLCTEMMLLKLCNYNFAFLNWPLCSLFRPEPSLFLLVEQRS